VYGQIQLKIAVPAGSMHLIRLAPPESSIFEATTLTNPPFLLNNDATRLSKFPVQTLIGMPVGS
jgi:hypothetical protein